MHGNGCREWQTYTLVVLLFLHGTKTAAKAMHGNGCREWQTYTLVVPVLLFLHGTKTAAKAMHGNGCREWQTYTLVVLLFLHGTKTAAKLCKIKLESFIFNPSVLQPAVMSYITACFAADVSIVC